MEPTAASKDEVIKRDVCQVITRGTYIDIQNGIDFKILIIFFLSFCLIFNIFFNLERNS